VLDLTSGPKTRPMSEKLPILYSFRRCPYAMRARLAVSSARISCELREVVLRDKAPELLLASPKGTVPVLVLPDGEVIAESLDIMKWALSVHDPDGWRNRSAGILPAFDAMQLKSIDELILRNDTSFKAALDRYKYSWKHPDADLVVQREIASVFLRDLESRLRGQPWLFGAFPSLADMAILPFIRQFSFVDRDWFLAEPWPNLIRWLDEFIESDRFLSIMTKYPKWISGDPITQYTTQVDETP
jgi:glutathione S-transferase